MLPTGRSRLLLASASPRRLELLRGVGVHVEVRPVDVDERPGPSEAHGDYLVRVVDSKRKAGLALASGFDGMLVADTIVVQDDQILGKPRDDGDALAMLRSLVGREHRVQTRYAVDRLGATGHSVDRVSGTVSTSVFVRNVDTAWLERYVATGEGRDKAGSYAIQGIFGAAIERIHGSYANVVGLPVCEVVEALERLGLVENFPAYLPV